MSNPINEFHLVGRLAADPRVMDNSDGSKRILFTLFVNRNYTNKDGQRTADALSLSKFITKDASSIGPYAHIHKGDLVSVNGALRSERYEKNGETVYDTSLQVDSLVFLEPRSVTQVRAAKNSAAEA